MLKHLFHDDSGFLVSTELILVATILVIGLIVGQVTLRDQLVTEIADVADAISALDHSYSYAEVTCPEANATAAGSSFDDAADFCDLSDSGQQGLSSSEGTCVIIDPDDGGTTGQPAPGVQSPSVGSDSI